MTLDADALGLMISKSRPRIPGFEQDIPSVLRRRVETTPDREAVVSRHGRWSYRELANAVHAAAAALTALGVARGDRVGASAAPCFEIVVAFLATQRLGAIWVGLNPQMAAPEKAFQLRDCGISVFLADESAFSQIQGLRGELPELRHVIDMQPGSQTSGWARLMSEHQNSDVPDVDIDPFAPAAIGYTSGTTGFPKGVVHSQHNMIVAAASRVGGLQGQEGPPDMRRGVAMGLTILNAIVRNGLATIIGGGCLVCMDRRDAQGIAEWIETERVEIMSLPGAIVYDFVNNPAITREKLKSLRAVGNSGSPVPEDLKARYRERFGHPVMVSYGLTEAPTTLTSASVDLPYVAGASGRPNKHIEVAILDENGAQLSPGEIGEICARTRDDGPWAGVFLPMLGYWKRPYATRQVMRGGWLHTSDSGYFDEDQNIFVVGRMSEMILRGGANVYPAEVERVISGDPRVRGVAVFGKPDERLGEIVVAVVEPAEGVTDTAALQTALMEKCRAELARYKIPEHWAFIDRFTRNANDKIVKAGLLDRFFS